MLVRGGVAVSPAPFALCVRMDIGVVASGYFVGCGVVMVLAVVCCLSMIDEVVSVDL